MKLRVVVTVIVYFFLVPLQSLVPVQYANSGKDFVLVFELVGKW